MGAPAPAPLSTPVLQAGPAPIPRLIPVPVRPDFPFIDLSSCADESVSIIEDPLTPSKRGAQLSTRGGASRADTRSPWCSLKAEDLQFFPGDGGWSPFCPKTSLCFMAVPTVGCPDCFFFVLLPGGLERCFSEGGREEEGREEPPPPEEVEEEGPPAPCDVEGEGTPLSEGAEEEGAPPPVGAEEERTPPPEEVEGEEAPLPEGVESGSPPPEGGESETPLPEVVEVWVAGLCFPFLPTRLNPSAPVWFDCPEEDLFIFRLLWF